MSSIPDLNLDPKIGKEAMEPTICSICLEDVIDGGGRSTAKLKCNHKFHLDCIGSEFNAKRAMQCPNCRQVEGGDWRYANGISNDPHIFEDDVEFHIEEHQTEDYDDDDDRSRPRLFGMSMDDFLSSLGDQTMASVYTEAIDPPRQNATGSQVPSSSTAYVSNAFYHQLQTLNPADLFIPINTDTDSAATHAPASQNFESADVETSNMLSANNPNSHAPGQQSQTHYQICNGSLDFISVSGTTRTTLNGPQNHSSAYSSSSAHNDSFNVLDSNNPDHHYSDRHSLAYCTHNPQRNGNVYRVSAPVPEVTRYTPNGPENHSEAYSYFGGRHGSLNAVSEPRTSMTMLNSPNSTVTSMHSFVQNYRSNARRAANSTVLSSSIGSHPTRVTRQPGNFGVFGTAASTILTQPSPYQYHHRHPAALQQQPQPANLETLRIRRNTLPATALWNPQTVTQGTAIDGRNHLQPLENASIAQIATVSNFTQGYPQPTLNQRGNLINWQNGRGRRRRLQNHPYTRRT